MTGAPQDPGEAHRARLIEVATRVGGLLGVEARVGHGEVVADVARPDWARAATAVRDDPVLMLTMFDLLTAVDDEELGVEVVLRLWSPTGRHALQLHTRCPPEDLRLASLTEVFAGTSWHERATAEMFGVSFEGHPNLVPLLLGEGAGHPLRKDVVLASRVVKAWPGAPEPGQSSKEAAASSPRRRHLPPGVPPAASWGAP